MKLDSIQPRFLRYRSYYKIYVFGFFIISFALLIFWSMKFTQEPVQTVLSTYSFEFSLSGLYFLICGAFYFFWLRSKLNKSIQVFSEYVLVHNGKVQEKIPYEDMESVNVVALSIFYVKMKSGIKHYFNSGFERVDYIWEGIYNARPDLIDKKDFDEYRVKLVQFDHHQKRKEWFFKHKFVDLCNWVLLPAMFIFFAYVLQTKDVLIHQKTLYFFRLFMYSLLIILMTSFFYSLLLKKLIFDKKVSMQMETAEDKIRDTEFEGLVLQRSKIFQFMSAAFVLSLLLKFDLNMFSVSKVREDIASFNLKKGHTILIDNRFNCVSCKFRLKDGDFILFGRGIIGQVLAQEGDMVGQIGQDRTGRMIASENVQEVPRGHVAVKAGNGKDIVFVKIEELIGKIQN